MTLCVSCPQGHSVVIAAGKLGCTVACPACFATFLAEDDYSAARQARKANRSRDDDDDNDDDDEDEEEEKPRKKKPAAKPKAKAKADQRVAPGKPPAKKAASKKDD